MQYHFLNAAIVSCLLVLPSTMCQNSIFGTPTQITGLKLEGGSGKCEGLLKIRGTSGDFGQACDLNNGDTEAMVVCRQLGCTAEGAQKVAATRYGFSSSVSTYIGFGSVCVGTEMNINSCRRSGSVCRADSAEYAVAIRCGGNVNSETSTIQTGGIVHLMVIASAVLSLLIL